MKIAVLGAGIVGVTSAWQLLRDGHEVTLIDRADGPARETSWGNAGLISTGHAFAWGNPGFLLAGLKGLAGFGGVTVSDRGNPDFWRWAWRFASTCTPAREAAITRAKHLLCLRSQALWAQTLHETRLAVAPAVEGALYLYRHRPALDRADRMARILRDNGQEIVRVDAAAITRIDPGLAGVAEGCVGALHAPADRAMSCHDFTVALAAHATENGLATRYDCTVLGLVLQRGRVTGVWTSEGGIDADMVVVALGPQAQPFLAQHGLKVPIVPIRGTSLTVRLPTGAGTAGPRMAGVDKGAGTAWRLSTARTPDGLTHRELRLTTGAAFAGFDTRSDPADLARLDHLAGVLLPDLDIRSLERRPWVGFRPMTPTGLPMVEEARPGLWLNIGHGHMGWTMAHATARDLADAVRDRQGTT